MQHKSPLMMNELFTDGFVCVWVGARYNTNAALPKNRLYKKVLASGEVEQRVLTAPYLVKVAKTVEIHPH